jgi:hypothetical protein
MSESIQYGTYYFPNPLPAIAESDNLIKYAGQYDHKATSISIIGFLTGANLSGLHLQKMQMISGFLNEYQNLNIVVGSASKTYSGCLVNSIQFAEGDLTTVLPYTVDLLSYQQESFSNYFGVADPVNTWSYSEQDNKIIQATHTVSAKGLKVNASDPFDNAKNFVTQKLQNGFEHIGVFNTGTTSGFLSSRTENIDRKADKYSVTEVYNFSSSRNLFSDRGICTVSTSISYNKNQNLSVTINGSIQGAIDASVNGGLLTTGDFTPEQAKSVAVNAVSNSISNFEAGVYSFLSNGPTSFDYSLNEGSNKLDFSFVFENADNLDLINQKVLHSYTTSVSASKDQSVFNVSVNGSLKYNAADAVITGVNLTGANNPRFLAVQSALSGVNQFALATKAVEDFRSVATGYKINSSYLNSEPIDYSIQKNPISNEITYNFSYNNSIDYSSGQLTDFKASIIDIVPLNLTKVYSTIKGEKAIQIVDRTMGEYSIDASCNDSESQLATLKEVAEGLLGDKSEGISISSQQTVGKNNISYNISKYY